MTPDELRAKVAEAIDRQYDDYVPYYNKDGACIQSNLADATIAVVIEAIAEELRETASLIHSHATIGSIEDRISIGIDQASNYLRSLLPKEST